MDENREKILCEVLEKMDEGVDVEKAKLMVSGTYHLSEGIRNSELLSICKNHVRYAHLKTKLLKKVTRTISGVTPVAVMTVSACPHGKCLYCPRGENAPQSYTGKEPAALRAKQNNFDSWLQIKSRIRQYEELGHPTDKCELIVMGGTFLAQSYKYKYNFIKGCYDAFNQQVAPNLKVAKEFNETAKHRIIGITIETRPDWCSKSHIDEMLFYGATRVELGVQTLRNDIYSKVKRGHTIEEVVKSTRLLKDSGYKICYHIMPGLLVSPGEDVEMFKQLFSDPKFRPDMLKIYPTLVMKGTGLYKMWMKGEYKPYDVETSVEVISEIYKYIPEYVRVMRVQRDIPVQLIVAGVNKSNLRELVEKRCEKNAIKIKEIRYREVGLSLYKMGGTVEEPKLKITLYEASGGIEYFISYVDPVNDFLFGFVRLRIPYEPFRPEVSKDTGLIRELHVYGSEVPLSHDVVTYNPIHPGSISHGSVSNLNQNGLNKQGVVFQHKGIGRLLMRKAEEIAKGQGMRDIVVLSGVGVRGYYRKLGYKLKGAYMWKIL